MAESDTRLLCHELLLRLAGRLPDGQLWRYRDWLAGAATEVLALSLPNALVRERVRLTDADHRLLSDALMPLGADPAVVEAILPGEEPRWDEYAFTAEVPAAERGDSEALVLGATLRGREGIHEVRSSWRRAVTGGEPARVVIVTATADAVTLTGEVQRILRALGKHAPLVEVFAPGVEPTPYHRAALAESVLVCAGAGELAAGGRRG